MSLDLSNFATIHDIYSNLMSRSARSAKYRIRSKFGIGISDARIIMSFMKEYDRTSNELRLINGDSYPSQAKVADQLTEKVSRLSVDVVAHLYKCKKL